MNTLSISADWPGKEAESLLWLASFPRSGNTFTRILLANYFAGDDAPYDINKLADFIPVDTNDELWRAFSSDVPAPTLSTWEHSWKARPDFIRHYRKTLTPSKFPGLKTHTANMNVGDRSGFDFRNSDRAIYIVRHPLDVLLSLSDYNSWDIDNAIQMMTMSGMAIFSEHHGGAMEVRGSWTEHASSWLKAPPCPLLLVRYEDLHGEPARVLREILIFLGTAVDPDRVNRAAEASRFEKVRDQETSNRFSEAPDTMRGGAFFRKGKALQWLNSLTPDQAYRLADACEPLMSKLGYTHPRDVYFDGRNALQPVNLRA